MGQPIGGRQGPMGCSIHRKTSWYVIPRVVLSEQAASGSDQRGAEGRTLDLRPALFLMLAVLMHTVSI
jgi:hypothetical protein